MRHDIDRRGFLKAGSAAGLGMLLPGLGFGQTKRKTMDTVRMGFVGVGGQGTGHFRNFLKIDGVEIKAVCDIDESRIERTQKMCADAGKPKPDAYTRGDEDYKRLCARDDIDLVYNATPWRFHVPVCLEAMNNGKHAATEIPASGHETPNGEGECCAPGRRNPPAARAS